MSSIEDVESVPPIMPDSRLFMIKMMKVLPVALVCSPVLCKQLV